MPRYTIAGTELNRDLLEKAFADAKKPYTDMDWTDLDFIFQIACEHPDRFPNINLQGAQTPAAYIERWVKRYHDAMKNPPSRRTASPKSACTDPAIKVIVKATQQLTEERAAHDEMAHNLFMSAENIQGNLLEEYIATKVRPYGFLWCNGNVLRAIDFCSTDGSLLLQIKNKSNTENSSSSSIREGTTIQKWYRLGTRTKHKVKFPDYKWTELNDLINRYRTQGHELDPCCMSEEDYQSFLSEKASANQNLITSQ